MKKQLSSMMRVTLLLSIVLFAACQRPMYDEEGMDTDNSRIPVKVLTRSASGSHISYPAHIYVFDPEDGSYKAKHTIADENDENMDLELLPGKYTVVALAGMGEEYTLPKEPNIEDVITMKSGNRSGRAMMMGSSTVTVKSGKQTSVNVTLYYAVASVEICLEDIPSTTEEVSFRLSPLYSALGFNGEYSGEGKDIEVECYKEEDGIWKAEPFYIFPGSGMQSSLSVTLKDEDGENTYGYTFKGCPEANVPFVINGSYKGKITVSGSLIGGSWEDANDVIFDFGPQVGEDDEKDNGDEEDEKPSSPTPAGVPEVGSIWNDGMVAAIEEGSNILLMSLEQWSAKVDNAHTKVSDSIEKGWDFPTREEAEILKETFGGDNLESTNETLENAEHLPLSTKYRYLYDKDGDMGAFGFKSSSQFLAAGNTVTYRIRLVRWVHYEEDDN